MHGDFYPLTPYTQDERQWIAWQFNGPEHGQGVVQAFRRGQCPAEQVRLKLHDLEPGASYTISPVDGAETKATDRELMSEGLAITLGSKPAAAVIVYSRR